MPTAALIVVDVQNDFCPGGALGVPGGEEVVPVLNEYARRFAEAGAAVFASRDWHPPETTHFRGQGGAWPPHCVQDTSGAAFHADLRLPEGTVLISKGTGPTEDAYSAFQARGESGVSLGDELRRRGVNHLYVGGLATDYCVKATVLDARARGFAATLLVDASRGVNLQPHDSERAIEEMVRVGATLATRETFMIS